MRRGSWWIYNNMKQGKLACLQTAYHSVSDKKVKNCAVDGTLSFLLLKLEDSCSPLDSIFPFVFFTKMLTLLNCLTSICYLTTLEYTSLSIRTCKRPQLVASVLKARTSNCDVFSHLELQQQSRGVCHCWPCVPSCRPSLWWRVNIRHRVSGTITLCLKHSLYL